MRASGRRRAGHERVRDEEQAEREAFEQFARVSGAVAAAFLRFYFGTAMPPPTPPSAAPRAPRREPFGDDLAALGLATMPDADGLRAAWRETARRTHPDAGGSAEAFQRARTAYERLALEVGA